MPYGDLVAQRVQRFADVRGPRPARRHHRGARGVRAAPPSRHRGLRRRRLRRDPRAGAGRSATSCCGTAATTTCPSTARPCTSRWRTRSARGTRLTYHPGEANLRMADVLVVNKIDSATDRAGRGRRRARSRRSNPTRDGGARPESRSPSTTRRRSRASGCWSIEDGPTLTHGEMKYGAGVVAARRARRRGDRRPTAVGGGHDRRTLREVRRRPGASGHGVLATEQLAEIEKMINAADADVVVIATPIDLRSVINIDKPGGPRDATTWRRLTGSPTIDGRPAARSSARMDGVERVVIALGGNALLRRASRTRSRPCTARPARPPRRGRHRRGRMGGRGHPRQRATGRPDPAAAGGGRRRVAPDAPRRLRGREPGPDRVPAAGHDRRRLLRAGDGSPGGHRAHADPGAPTTPPSQDPTKPIGPYYEEEEADELVARTGVGDGPDSARRAGAAWCPRPPVLDRGGPGDPELVGDGRDRHRRGRGRSARGGGGPAAGRRGGRRGQGPRRRDPGPGRPGRRRC